MELILLIVAGSVLSVLAVPWVLAYSRREQTRARWPQTITRTHTEERAGVGAYRTRSVEVERVVSIESGAPAPVGRGARRALSAAASMFVGGVLCGAWIPVSIWLSSKTPLFDDFSVAYGSGLLVAIGWIAAALSQFHAAWDRWETSYEIAASETAAAFRLAVIASVVSLLAVAATRATYGASSTLVPLWFSLYALGRAMGSARSLRAVAALYARAEANEKARIARQTRDVDPEDEGKLGSPRVERSGVRVVVSEPVAALRGDRLDDVCSEAVANGTGKVR